MDLPSQGFPKLFPVHQSYITKDTRGNNSHRRERKIITNMRDQEKLSIMTSSANQQNLKMNSSKSKEQST
jgi:hypothetical protein